jgi:hypothetical protein
MLGPTASSVASILAPSMVWRCSPIRPSSLRPYSILSASSSSSALRRSALAR